MDFLLFIYLITSLSCIIQTLMNIVTIRSGCAYGKSSVQVALYMAEIAFGQSV